MCWFVLFIYINSLLCEIIFFLTQFYFLVEYASLSSSSKTKLQTKPRTRYPYIPQEKMLCFEKKIYAKTKWIRENRIKLCRWDFHAVLMHFACIFIEQVTKRKAEEIHFFFSFWFCFLSASQGKKKWKVNPRKNALSFKNFPLLHNCKCFIHFSWCAFCVWECAVCWLFATTSKHNIHLFSSSTHYKCISQF